MGPNLLRQGKSGGHEKRGPEYRVETNDLLADQVNVGRPETAAFVFGTTDGAEVGGECVKPDVENVGFFAGNRDAPADRRPGDAKVLQPAFDEAQNFIAAGIGLDEVRVLFVEIEKGFLECRQLEEIVRFGDGFRRPAAIGAIFTGLHVNVRVVENTILPGVVSRIDVAILAAQAEKPLNGAGVANLCGADEFVALDAELVP